MLSYLPRTKMMIEKLFDQVSRGTIDNDWAENFICDMRERLKMNMGLTQKQLDKIEELFERY